MWYFKYITLAKTGLRNVKNATSSYSIIFTFYFKSIGVSFSPNIITGQYLTGPDRT